MADLEVMYQIEEEKYPATWTNFTSLRDLLFCHYLRSLPSCANYKFCQVELTLQVGNAAPENHSWPLLTQSAEDG